MGQYYEGHNKRVLQQELHYEDGTMRQCYRGSTMWVLPWGSNVRVVQEALRAMLPRSLLPFRTASCSHNVYTVLHQPIRTL